MKHDLAPPTMIPPTEAVSQESLQQLTAVADRLHRYVPEFVGMTVYGSVSRGQASSDSDTDVFIFMETTDRAESVQMNPRIPAEQPKTRVRDDSLTSNYGSHPTHVFHPAIDLDYKAFIRDQLSAESIPSADVDVLPINEEIIDQSTQILLESAQRYTVGDVGDLSLPRNIRCLFHSSVDDERLRPYIQRVLANLAASQFGNLAWSAIRHRVIAFEQGRDGNFADNPHRFIPETLEDARSYFLSATSTR